jgi:uncharacterized protein YndB with AHSA1/START domain
MKTLQFRVEIAAPVAKVWDTMLGKETYPEWTLPFTEGSYFEGSWSEGERMRFLCPSGDGMVAVIETNRPHEMVSIKHLGFVKDGVEDTSSDAVRSWAPAYEKYRFAEVEGGTEVSIAQDVTPDFEKCMLDTWPKALAALKKLCEAD